MPPSLTLHHLAQWLSAGQPRQVLRWAQAVPHSESLAAAAALRLGDTAAALRWLEASPPNARRAVLQARALWLAGQDGGDGWAQEARAQARREGDAPALVAAVTLLAEQQLLSGQGQPDQERFVPLRTLAEGFKVSELAAQPAEPHLLAVLAAAQATCTPGQPRKAAQSAHKALERASGASPAQVGALLLLGRNAEARQQQAVGELDSRWLRVFERVAGGAQIDRF